MLVSIQTANIKIVGLIVEIRKVHKEKGNKWQEALLPISITAIGKNEQPHVNIMAGTSGKLISQLKLPLK